MDQLAKSQQTKFEAVWDPQGTGNYRLGSPGLRLVKTFMEYSAPGCTVNDYGAGTGRAAVALLRSGYHVNMVDLARNALEEEARSLLGEHLTWTHASLWNLPPDFPKAPWGFCVDVLMTTPAEKLDKILAEIRRTCDNLFAQVYTWSDMRLGMEFTTIRMDAPAWKTRFLAQWDNVELIRSKEDYRRFIFVCK